MVLRRFLTAQVNLSRRVERLLPEINRRDGNLHYIQQVVPPRLKPNLRISDVGGGKRPFLSAAEKRQLSAHVVGIDIDANELARAEPGAYDETIAADIATLRGGGG